MDSTTLFLSLILPLSGVVVGWALQWITSELREKREIRRAVSMAAAVCFGRLKKMIMARQMGDDQIFNDEKYHLGQDSDRFLQALSRRSKIKSHEMQIYEDASALLLGMQSEDLIDDQIKKLIEDFQNQIIYAA